MHRGFYRDNTDSLITCRSAKGSSPSCATILWEIYLGFCALVTHSYPVTSAGMSENMRGRNDESCILTNKRWYMAIDGMVSMIWFEVLLAMFVYPRTGKSKLLIRIFGGKGQIFFYPTVPPYFPDRLLFSYSRHQPSGPYLPARSSSLLD